MAIAKLQKLRTCQGSHLL